MATISKKLITDKINQIAVNSAIKCNPANYSKCSKREITYIVVHYTGNEKDTAQANCTYFSNGSRSSSAHIFVDNSNIYQSVDLCNVAWHCGCSSGYKSSCRNKNSIGIEMCTSGTYLVSKQTQINAAYVCAYLCKLIGITEESVDTYVLRHYDVVASNKKCPAQFVSDPSQWIKFKTWIKNILQTGSHTTSSSAISSSTVSSPSDAAAEFYRIRKTWADSSSQIGAYISLENAKIACKNGYYVFDSSGKSVYPSPSSANHSSDRLKIESDINSVQAWLNTYYKTRLTVDGIYGTKTKTALIKAWQTEVGGIAANGIWGTKCKTVSASHIIKKGSVGILTTIWQAYLTCRGYSVNKIDGNFTKNCKNATISFQKSNGLAPDGQVGKNTWTKAFS